MIIIRLLNNQKSCQIEADILTLSLLREHFSVPNPAYRLNKKFIASRLYAITPSGKFEIGFLEHILSWLDSNQKRYQIEESLCKKYFNGFDFPKIKELSIKYRDYQEKAIYAALKKCKGIISIPTAGGKTLIMAGVIESLRENINDLNALTLVLVPSIQLVEQTASDFESYGLKNITKWSGNNEPDFSKKIIVAGTQILLSEKTDLSILDQVKIIIVDETHGLRKGNEINKIFNLINADYKFGFTGTMPPNPIDQWNIIGKIGPIVYEEKTKDLKNQKYVSNFKIVILNVIHNPLPKFTLDFSKPTKAYNDEIEHLINNNRRNEIIAKLSLRLKNNTIIMVDRIDHGINLESYLKSVINNNQQVYFIRGSTEVEEREKIRKLMEKQNNIIVIAISKIFSTGINIPNLHNIIFASAGKAKIKIMQSIGRALRLHPTKEMAIIFDVADNTKYARKHLKERIELYKTESYNYEEKNIT